MWLLLACSDKSDDSSTPEDTAADDTAVDDTGDTRDTADLPDVEVIHVTTDDGVVLEGDWYAADAGDPGVLLLHMSPLSGYDRTVWPADFIDALRGDGFAVLALDRRGAGGSEGDPGDAAGEPGVYDARAAVDFMVGAGIGDLALIGASSGTTTSLDYVVTAAEAGYPAPASLVFMSPGTYTEAQHTIDELTAPPLMVTYPESEATWNENHQDDAPDTWRWEEYGGNLHAALILPENPTVGDDIRAWLRGEAAPGVYTVP